MNTNLIQVDEFEFIVDGNHYFVPLSVIKAFSGTVKEIVRNKQPLIYNFERLHDPLRQFKLFIDLLNGLSIDISEQNAFFLGYIGDELDISLLSQATNSYRQIPLTLDNIFDILNQLGMLNISYPQVIDFAGSNWPQISKRKELIHLPFSILNEIFTKNPNITFDYNFVIEAIHENSLNENQMHESEYISLFKFCDFTSFTPYQINQMIDFTFYDSSQISVLQKIIPSLLIGNPSSTKSTTNKNNSISSPKNQSTSKNEQKNVTTKIPPKSEKQDMLSKNPPSKSSNQNLQGHSSSPIFDNVTNPAKGTKGSRNGKPSPVPPEPSHFVNIEYEPGFELNGIISMFQNNYSKSRWKDEVLVQCSESTKSFLKYTIFDFSSDKYWDNYDGSSCKFDTAWITVGFPNYSLRLTNYTIAPKQMKKNFRPPKSWKIYGSNDPSHFNESDLVDYVKEAPTMNILDKINTFEVKGKAKPYSYFKFVMIENYSTKKLDAGDFNISALEFFGILTHL